MCRNGHHDQLKEERISSHDSDERGDSSSDCWSDESGDAVEKQWRHDVSGWGSGDAGELESMWQHFDDRLGFLYFQYFETSAPCGRVPLMDKVALFFHFNQHLSHFLWKGEVANYLFFFFFNSNSIIFAEFVVINLNAKAINRLTT